jgi:hypothetical protein
MVANERANESASGKRSRVDFLPFPLAKHFPAFSFSLDFVG